MLKLMRAMDVFDTAPFLILHLIVTPISSLDPLEVAIPGGEDAVVFTLRRFFDQAAGEGLDRNLLAAPRKYDLYTVCCPL